MADQTEDKNKEKKTNIETPNPPQIHNPTSEEERKKKRTPDGDENNNGEDGDG